MSKLVNRKQLLAILICICFIAISTLSFSYITLEAEHHCTGENCSTCVYIHAVQNTLRQLLIAYADLGAVVIILIVTCLIYIYMLINIKQSTPITLKVRMNN